MRRSITALSSAIVPAEDTDAPDPSDEWIQRISRETGFSADSIAQICAKVFASTVARTGIRPALEDIVAAVEVTIHEKRKTSAHALTSRACAVLSRHERQAIRSRATLRNIPARNA
jgi:hypothetical protein